MTCPVNVSLSGGYPDGRTRRRGQEPAEPPQVRGIRRFSARTTGTPNAEVLALADEIAGGTINKVMAKSDLELGIEALHHDGPI